MKAHPLRKLCSYLPDPALSSSASLESWANRATDAPVLTSNPVAGSSLALLGFRRREGRGVCRACAVNCARSAW